MTMIDSYVACHHLPHGVAAVAIREGDFVVVIVDTTLSEGRARWVASLAYMRMDTTNGVYASIASAEIPALAT
jgi:hypothetical protein